jgi:hypothetical protein
MVTDEADAVLAILQIRAAGGTPSDSDWQRLFGSEYYTVGWLMSSVVERGLGRERLVESLCDPAMFLRDYNRAAEPQMKKGRGPLPLWSDTLLERLSVPPLR